MSATTKIEWTERTWNPVTGCTKVSAGCKNCYAEKVADRFWASQYPPVEYPTYSVDNCCPVTEMRARRFTDVQTHEDRLVEPLAWRKPSLVFVNSMSDLFHEDVPDEFILHVLNVIRRGHANGHTFQVLTKRHERMRSMMSRLQFDSHGVGRLFLEDRGLTRQGTPISFAPVMRHLWLGVSVENQETADQRIPLLLQTPAAVRFISAEPLIGPIDFSVNPSGQVLESCDECGHRRPNPSCDACLDAPPALDWVIVGGESGPGARPLDLAWARSILAQCKAAGVAAFMKQLGADPRGECSWEHHDDCPPTMVDKHGVRSSVSGQPGTLCHAVDDAWWPCRLKLKDRKGGRMEEWPEDLRVRQFPRVEATS